MINVTRADLWSAPLEDRPGGLVAKIEELVLNAGLDITFLLAERVSDQTTAGAVFLTSISGERQEALARQHGFVRDDRMFSLRVVGNDEPGIAYRLLKVLAERGLNLRAVSVSTHMGQFVMHVAFDSPADAEVAMKVLRGPT